MLEDIFYFLKIGSYCCAVSFIVNAIFVEEDKGELLIGAIIFFCLGIIFGKIENNVYEKNVKKKREKENATTIENESNIRTDENIEVINSENVIDSVEEKRPLIEEKVCKNCGAVLKENYKYCGQCGTKVEE